MSSATFDTGLAIPTEAAEAAPTTTGRGWRERAACIGDDRMVTNASYRPVVPELIDLALRCRNECPAFAECRASVADELGRVTFERTWLVVAGEIAPRYRGRRLGLRRA